MKGMASWCLAGSLLLAACSGDSAICQEGEGSCSADALLLTVCRDGDWQEVDCMQEHGQLCESGACVDPWRYGSPAWPRVEDEPRATSESLYQKMEYYQVLARRLHVHPDLKFATSVSLPCATQDCSQTSVAEEDATWRDVTRWWSGENDGLFSGLYMAAEAYHYAVTGDRETLLTLKILLEGEQDRMDITGVPGNFTRQYIPPGIDGIACPEDLSMYVPDVEKDDNRWVRVGDDGCVYTVDGQTMEWVASDHCGLDAFAGWCWLDNVSKDEYSGHMFALGAVQKLVDDPEVQEIVSDLLGKVGHHLVDNKLNVIDWDGRVTEHGKFWAMALDDYPGFNAAMALSYILEAAVATGDTELWAFYYDCLLQSRGEVDCIQQPLENPPKPYPEHLPNHYLYRGDDSCKSNWNDFSMHMLSMHNLVWFEHDPDRRAAYQNSLDVDVFDPPDTPRALIEQHNTFFDFIYAAQKPLGPDSDGPALTVVEDGIRMLRQFPATQHQQARECPPEVCVLSGCTDRFDRPLSENPREVADCCASGFHWWWNPYWTDSCTENPSTVFTPTDYLLAYWMGRYYGFISEDM